MSEIKGWDRMRDWADIGGYRRHDLSETERDEIMGVLDAAVAQLKKHDGTGFRNEIGPCVCQVCKATRAIVNRNWT